MNQAPLQVLVVDDERAIRDVISDFLGMERYQVATAENGEQAMRMLAESNFDLVLTDLEMPRVNGLDLLRHLKTLKRVPLAVIMTGYATVENAVEAMRVGAHDYILKPFKVDEVLHTVRKAAEKIHLERENLQLKQAVSLYYVSEAMSLSLPLDTVLDIITDAVLQEVALDVTAVFLADRGDEKFTVRKRKSRLPHVADGILQSLEWPRLIDEFAGDRSVLANGADARAFFAGSADIEGFIAIPLRVRNKVIGALVGISATRGQVFHEGERRLLSILGGRTAAAVDNAVLYEDLQLTFTNTIEGLVSALEAKDEYTAGHSQRVARWAEIVARLAKLPDEEVARVRKAALLHDIGKIGVNEGALTKPDKLTPDEFDSFKTHPSVGRKILEPLQFLGPIVDYVHYHHERYDGSGYPVGLKGEDIPLGARILCLADSFEVMSTDRAYRKRLPREIALAELRRCAGTQFDPELTKLLVGYLEGYADFREAMENPRYGRPLARGLLAALG